MIMWGVSLSSTGNSKSQNSILQEIIKVNQENNKDKHSFHSKSTKQKNIIKDIILNTEKK